MISKYTEKCIVNPVKIKLFSDKISFDSSTIFGKSANYTFKLNLLNPEPINKTATGFEAQLDLYYLTVLILGILYTVFLLFISPNQLLSLFSLICVVLASLAFDSKIKINTKIYFFDSVSIAFWIRERGMEYNRFEDFAVELEQAIKKSKV